MVIETSKTSVYFTFKERMSFYEKNKQINKPYTLSIVTCPTVAYAAETKQTTDSPNMKDILIDSTDVPFYRCINS
mgnify:CR=1 FL=1